MLGTTQPEFIEFETPTKSHGCLIQAWLLSVVANVEPMMDLLAVHMNAKDKNFNLAIPSLTETCG